jgi:hypothetical protein
MSQALVSNQTNMSLYLYLVPTDDLTALQEEVARAIMYTFIIGEQSGNILHAFNQFRLFKSFKGKLFLLEQIDQ